MTSVRPPSPARYPSMKWSRRPNADRTRAKASSTGFKVGGAEDDGERGEPAETALQLLQRDRRRSALRQQFAQVGAQVAIEPHRERDRRREDEKARGGEE